MNAGAYLEADVVCVVDDVGGAADGDLRVIDESGEDYLYHKSHFALVDFPPAVRKKILALKEVA